MKQETVTYTIPQVAELLGMSNQWVRQQVHAGEIPHVRIGGTVLIPRRQLEELLAGKPGRAS